MQLRLLTEHPAEMGETYLQHLRFALRFGGTMLVGGVACMVHGLLPFCFTTSGSRRVRELHGVLNRPGPRALPRQAKSPALPLDEFNWSI